MNPDPAYRNIETFFRQEYGRLVGFVRKNLEDRFFGASPEDIVQDVALGVISRLDPETQIVNLSAYVYRAVRNRITDLLRKKQRNVSIEEISDSKERNYILNQYADETKEEDNYLSTDPVTLREAIAKLRPDEQVLIIATEFEGRGYEELSEEWEIPVGTLLSRKHRALSKLYKILLEQDIKPAGMGTDEIGSRYGP